MRRYFTGQYPQDWKDIAKAAKERAGWKCERCGDPNSAENVLTVHHLDNDKTNVEPWNLAALCQRCHLHIQGKVNMFQDYMFEHSPWMMPHVHGRNAALANGDWPRPNYKAAGQAMAEEACLSAREALR